MSEGISSMFIIWPRPNLACSTVIPMLYFDCTDRSCDELYSLLETFLLPMLRMVLEKEQACQNKAIHEVELLQARYALKRIQNN